jgi:hypothetical protein
MLIVKEILGSGSGKLQSLNISKYEWGNCTNKITVKDTKTWVVKTDYIQNFNKEGILGIYEDVDSIRVCPICEEGLFLLDYADDCRIPQSNVPKDTLCVYSDLLPINDLYAKGDQTQFNPNSLAFITDIILSAFLSLENGSMLEQIDKIGMFYIYNSQHNGYLIKLKKGACQKVIELFTYYGNKKNKQSKEEIKRLKEVLSYFNKDRLDSMRNKFRW